MADCWASDLKTDLSQGDLLSLVLVGTAAEPKTALTRGPTRKKGLESWDTSAWKADGDDFGYFLARGREVHVVVVSEDCEIDKDDGKIPVLVAPVFSQDALQTDDARQAVLQGRRFPFLAVEAIPDVIPASYVDLRSITFINRKLMARARRKKSMSSIGVNSLIQQIIAFFTHISVDELRTANRIDEK